MGRTPSERANLPVWHGEAGHYEIWYVVLFDAEREAAYWLRYEVFAPKGKPPIAILWATVFDQDGDSPRVRSAKRFIPIERYDRGHEGLFHVRFDDAAIGHGFLRGRVEAEGVQIAWDLTFIPKEKPARRTPSLLSHLPWPVKEAHANPEVAFVGYVEVDGERRALHGARGTQAHVHGTRRVCELRWAYATAFAEDPGAAIELVSTRVDRKVLGLPAPAFTSLWLKTSSEELDFTELSDGWMHRVDTPGPGRLRLRSSSPSRSIIVHAWDDPPAYAGFVYRDTNGDDLHVAQSDLANVTVEIFERPSRFARLRPRTLLTSQRAAALEFHQPEPQPGVRYVPWDGVSPEATPRSTGPTAPATLPAEAPGDPGRFAPVPAPNAIFALGLTYASLIRETGGDPEKPAEPLVFEKDLASYQRRAPRVVMPDTATMLRYLDDVEPGLAATLRQRYGFLPAMLDYEVELALVLLDPVHVPDLDRPDFAPRIGWCVGGDLTARSCQLLGEGHKRSEEFWSLAKSFPGFCPLASEMWVPDEPRLDRVPSLRLRTTVNGVVRQDASTSELAFGVRDLLRAVLRRAKRPLAPGDVVLTGTPSGVAFRLPAWQRAIGDRLLDRMGKLEAGFGVYLDSADFLRPGDRVVFEGGFLGVRSFVVG